MSEEYTPTTGHIQDAWTGRYDGENSSASDEEYQEYRAEFERWLAAHEAELREQIAVETRDIPLTSKECFQRLGVGGVAVLIRELQAGLEHFKIVNKARGTK